MSSIPPELHFDILLRLHPKDLLRCMCVSKSWCSLIRDKRFIKAQLEASIEANCFRTVLVFGLYNSGYRDIYSLPFYHDDTFGTPKKTEKPLEVEGIYAGIVGCSNGVVCIYSWKSKRDCHMIAVWNPSIQKMKKLPSPTFDPPSSHRLKFRGPFFGFGYDSVNDDFKLVAIASFVNQGNLVDVSHVKTYSLKSNSWRRIQNLACIDFEFANGMIVFCNGAMSMLMHNSHPLRHIGGSEFESRHIILTLDIATEEYHEFSIPFKYASSHHWVLGILGGCICTYVFDYNGDLCDVWIMKEYGVVESWTLLCSIDVQYIRPFYGYEYCCHQFPKDGAMLLFMGRMHSFSWYDLEKKSFKHVEVQGLPARQFDRMTICCASLYLLDGDPVSGEVLSTSKKRKLSSNASGNVEAIVDDQIREQK